MLCFLKYGGSEEKNQKCRQVVFEYIKVLEEIVKEGIDNGEFLRK